MLFFSRVKIKEFIKVQEWKRKQDRCLVFTSSIKREIRHFHVVARRAVTAKKCSKKRAARAKLLFCQSKPITILPFSLTSPSSLLKMYATELLSAYYLIVFT